MNWRFARLLPLGTAFVVLLTTHVASSDAPAAAAPPWHELPMVPLPADARSVESNRFDVPVWDGPGGARRGSLLAGARLPILGSRRPMADCRERWFLVGESAWVCGSEVHFSRLLPGAPARPSTADGLPHRYYFAGHNGAFGYSALSLVGEGIPDSQLEPGFAVAVVRETSVGNERVAYTTNGLWIPLAELVPARVPSFQGVHLEHGKETPVGWVLGAGKHGFTEPFGKRTRKLEPRTSVSIRERRRVRGAVWLLTEDGDWLRERDVRLPTPASPPVGISGSERWLDIDTRSQILTAYVGERPVFATLVSTGKGMGSSETATPVGEHRIWVKLATSDMTNVEDPGANSYYAIEAVPWVQFFDRGYALHAAFWHDGFGARRSHGCVNLSPKDAEFLFTWTNPWLPPGWHAVHPTAAEPGTLVRVR